MCVSEIAAIIGSDGRTVPLSEPGTVVVYRMVRGTWLAERRLPFSLNGDGGLAGLRNQTGELVAFLGTCKTLVAQSASGALFFGLAKAGFSVFEIAGSPPEFLSSVLLEAKEEQEGNVPVLDGADIPAPLEISPGKYYISIREIQGKRPEMSSKQVLRSFVQAGAFSELEIICDHMPPWIEVDAERLGYDLTREQTGLHDMKVLIRRSAGGCC
ncbi:Fe-only nitrogenase accessory AnfO family protein [Methanoregula sp.]|uniref:Fe-only nitrogenase accessory AnfO family protein n=1 Tax=Methanoregula sp. TaxID=2052170 RepID=UPI0035648844